MMKAEPERNETRLMLYIDKPLKKWVEAKAASLNVSMTRYIEGLIAEAKIEDGQ